MGFLDRFTKGPAVPDRLMSDEQEAQLAAAQQQLAAMMAANPGAMPDLGDPAATQAAAARSAEYAERVRRLGRHGVEAPAVIRSVAPTGHSDLGGGREFEIAVTIEGGGEAVAVQSMLPDQLAALQPGRSVTVKHDPATPGQALLVGW